MFYGGQHEFYGLKLRMIRNFHGLSLEEVGQRVAASRQFIQQLEKGVKQPNEKMILALADALDVEKGFFLSAETNPLVEEQCHFRSLLSTKSSTRAQAVAYGNLFENFVQHLEKILDFPEVNFPEHTVHGSNDDIERISENCRLHWELGLDKPINNMIRVAENAGALIVDFVEVSEKVDAFSVHRGRPLIIRNLAKESSCRRRFDVAHECGHIIMHAGVITGDKKTEDEANRFASAFLFPRAVFSEEFPHVPKNGNVPWNEIYNLKKHWKISATAIVRRAYELELIGAAQYRRAHINLSMGGQRKQEKYDDQIAPEDPELIYSALSLMEKNAHGELLYILKNMSVKQKLLKTLTSHSFDSRHDYATDKIIPFNPPQKTTPSRE